MLTLWARPSCARRISTLLSILRVCLQHGSGTSCTFLRNSVRGSLLPFHFRRSVCGKITLFRSHFVVTPRHTSSHFGHTSSSHSFILRHTSVTLRHTSSHLVTLCHNSVTLRHTSSHKVVCGRFTLFWSHKVVCGRFAWFSS